MRKKSGFFSRKVIALIVVVLVVVCVVAAYQFAGKGGSGVDTGPATVVLVTSMGNITIEVYGDMPITSGNFKDLVEMGAYDGTVFHRVVAGFVIQGGDLSGKGMATLPIEDELPNKYSNVRWSVAMAKSIDPDTEEVIPDSATSQFYINLVDNLYLDSAFSVFGQVVAGMDVVDAIGAVETDANDKPLVDVTLISASIIG